ncbi:hypothetical protein ULVI_10235 [Cochleicola gelatinilyticus]|uniref:Uncharacterized protein n=2 Tax=Cochleicola gelatinilyticus TaxID=1763537 RepID=A0A167HTD9_9FLAO|nr:hypothetical protein ULVI_10235 [Cochleicola gelatinilyticus]
MLISVTCVFSQNDKTYVDQLIDEFILELKDKGIDQFFYTQRYCVGEIVIYDLGNNQRCISKGTNYETYFFWEKDEIVYGKKIDNCGSYYPLIIENKDLITFMNFHFQELRFGFVRPFISENRRKVPSLRTPIYACYRNFQFIKGDETVGQTYNTRSTTTEPDMENVNYIYNSNLKIVLFDRLLNTAIENIELSTDLKRI